MYYKNIITALSIIIIISFFLPWISTPIFEDKISALGILLNSEKLNNPITNLLYFIPAIGLVMFICNQRNNIYNNVMMAFAGTFSFIFLISGIAYLINYCIQYQIYVFDLIGSGAMLTILVLSIFTYDIIIVQTKKYAVKETN